jgi:hypothetical protein
MNYSHPFVISIETTSPVKIRRARRTRAEMDAARFMAAPKPQQFSDFAHDPHSAAWTVTADGIPLYAASAAPPYRWSYAIHQAARMDDGQLREFIERARRKRLSVGSCDYSAAYAAATMHPRGPF